MFPRNREIDFDFVFVFVSFVRAGEAKLHGGARDRGIPVAGGDFSKKSSGAAPPPCFLVVIYVFFFVVVGPKLVFYVGLLPLAGCFPRLLRQFLQSNMQNARVF